MNDDFHNSSSYLWKFREIHLWKFQLLTKRVRRRIETFSMSCILALLHACIFFYTYRLAYLLAYLHMFAYLHNCILVYFLTCIPLYLHTYNCHTCIITYLHTCILAQLHTCIHAYMPDICLRYG